MRKQDERWFGQKVYSRFGTYTDKQTALRTAREIRSTGALARVEPSDAQWAVWTWGL